MSEEESNNDTSASSASADGKGAGFTQADVDRIVQERIARERAKFAGYDELKARAAKADELEQAQLTELDRERTKTAALEKQLTESESKTSDHARRLAVFQAAAAPIKLGDREVRFTNPTDALAFLPADLDASDSKAVGAALQNVLNERPYLAANPVVATSFDGGARTTSAAPQDMNDVIRRSAGYE